jgi:hypothetical protein
MAVLFVLQSGAIYVLVSILRPFLQFINSKMGKLPAKTSAAQVILQLA